MPRNNLLPLKLTRPLVAYDIETTGIEDARIVELAFTVYYPDDRLPYSWSRIINPLVPIPADATAVHGITDVKVQSCQQCGATRELHSDHDFVPYPTFRQLAPSLVKGLSNVDFIGYNIKFDLRVTLEEMTRAGVSWTYATANIIDAYRLWQLLEPRSLEDAVRKFLFREPTHAHRAAGDADDAVDVTIALIDLARLAGWEESVLSTVSALGAACFPQDANRVDSDGKFIWKNNDVVVMFGKHRGQSLKTLPQSYLRWVRDTSQLSDEVKRLCAGALAGRYPTRSVASQETAS